MSPQRILGVALLVVGIVLFVMGMNASNSMGDQLHHDFTGRFTDTTTWYIVGGIGSAVVGGLLMMFGAGGKEA